LAPVLLVPPDGTRAEQMILDEVDSKTRGLLERFGFEPALFEELRARVASGELSPETNVVQGMIEPPRDEDLTLLPAPAEPGYSEAHEAGVEALRQGKVAQIVLAGGMATRFGGVVKAAVPAVDGRSFLHVKLTQTRELEGRLEAQIPVALMTSFATDSVVRNHVVEQGLGEPLVFHQFVSLRLEPDGELFRDEEGRPSLYAPGHGDLFQAVRRSGVLASLRDRGVRVVTVSNVDNLGARIEPAIVGMHLLAERPLTSEVARKEGDLGGAPVRVDGRLQLLEGPRFPPSFDQDLTPVFNTNTALFDVDALDRDYDLTWLYVLKRAGGRDSVQLERVYHEASAYLPTTYLEVPRRGPRGRFFPIKTPEDLARAQGDLRELLAASPI
jgi:UTP--glucose-1-phosphate uridylyltransferase